MNEYWRDILYGTKSLFIGLKVTGPEFFKPVITEQYPHFVPVMKERFRGHIELTRNEETGGSNCVVCGMCQRACPSSCITVEGEKPEGSKKKGPDQVYSRFYQVQSLRLLRGKLQLQRHSVFQGIQPGKHQQERLYI